jgi:hypothetical protein
MSKELRAEDSDGENVGLLKFSKEAADALFDAAKGLVAQGHEKSWLGVAVQEIAHSHQLKAVDVAGLPWAEVDSSYDLDKVRKTVMPRIKRETRLHRALVRGTVALGSVGIVVLLAYLANLALLVEPKKAWENAPIKGAQSTLLTSPQGEQEWWALPGEQLVRAQVVGPDTIRLDTRVTVTGDEQRDVPYVIEVTLDGERLEWLSYVSEPSGSWKHEGGSVGQRTGTKIKIPEGSHELGLRTIASAGGALLVRVRHVSSDYEE